MNPRFSVIAATGMVLSGCLGGGSNPVVPAAVAPVAVTNPGNVNPLLNLPPSAPAVGQVAPATPPANTLLAPNTPATAFAAVAQSLNLTTGVTTDTATALTFNPVDLTAKAIVSTGAANPLPADQSLGMLRSLSLTLAAGTAPNIAAGTFVPDAVTLAGLPATRAWNGGAVGAAYAAPYSAVQNPQGYTYQTFGWWDMNMNRTPGAGVLGYLSAGVPTTAGTLPVAGTASYAGQAIGTYVDLTARKVYETEAVMNATADFAARQIAFSTTGSTMTPRTTAPTASPNAGLDMTGTLSYLPGNNTFNGPVTSTNGMAGSATGRFYGPVVFVPGGNPTGQPAEIGGTFALYKAGSGAMIGAFGGK